MSARAAATEQPLDTRPLPPFSGLSVLAADQEAERTGEEVTAWLDKDLQPEARPARQVARRIGGVLRFVPSSILSLALGVLAFRLFTALLSTAASR